MSALQRKNTRVPQLCLPLTHGRSSAQRWLYGHTSHVLRLCCRRGLFQLRRMAREELKHCCALHTSCWSERNVGAAIIALCLRGLNCLLAGIATGCAKVH